MKYRYFLLESDEKYLNEGKELKYKVLSYLLGNLINSTFKNARWGKSINCTDKNNLKDKIYKHVEFMFPSKKIDNETKELLDKLIPEFRQEKPNFYALPRKVLDKLTDEIQKLKDFRSKQANRPLPKAKVSDDPDSDAINKYYTSKKPGGYTGD